MKAIRRFRSDESGAVTADWVVLSALVMILAVATVASARKGALTLAPEIVKTGTMQLTVTKE